MAYSRRFSSSIAKALLAQEPDDVFSLGCDFSRRVPCDLHAHHPLNSKGILHNIYYHSNLKPRLEAEPPQPTGQPTFNMQDANRPKQYAANLDQLIQTDCG